MHVDITRLNDSFYATFLQALEVARRTNEQEKRAALKNAVLNTATPSAPDDSLRHIFINMVDEFSALHLRLFGFILHPEKFGMDVESYRELHGPNPYNP